MKDRKNALRALIEIAIITPLLLVFPISKVPAGQHHSADRLPQVNWVNGPRTVDLGNDVARIDLGEAYIFANAEDTRKIMEYSGEPVSQTEAGLILPKDRNKDWSIIFRYYPVGYVRDDEKDSLDSDAILQQIKSATEKANKIRRKKGSVPVNVIGWYEKPHYDGRSHNLVWAVLGEEEGGYRIVNYNVRLLGRKGYVSVVLVTNPPNLASFKSEVESIIANFSYKRGKRYADFVQGNKLAKYGLTALIAGGAGAAAVKFGLLKFLAKAWKLVLLGAFAFFAAISKIIKAIFTREDRIA